MIQVNGKKMILIKLENDLIKMIKIIFHVFDSSNDSSQVIWVKSKSNSSDISGDQTKTKNLIHDTSQTNMWFESNHLMIQVRWEFNSSHIPWFESSLFHVYQSKLWKKKWDFMILVKDVYELNHDSS